MEFGISDRFIAHFALYLKLSVINFYSKAFLYSLEITCSSQEYLGAGAVNLPVVDKINERKDDFI